MLKIYRFSRELSTSPDSLLHPAPSSRDNDTCMKNAPGGSGRHVRAQR
jgi:hypothetical protein